MVFIEPFNFSFFSVTGQSIDLDYRDIEYASKFGKLSSFIPVPKKGNAKEAVVL